MKEFINALVATFFIYIIFPGCLVSQSQTFDNDLRENVYVQTDRDIYMAGEYLHFKSHLLNDNDKDLSSSYIYLTLKSENEIISSVTVPVKDDNSGGSVYLYDTLSTGYYEIIANTNWMKNQGEDSYFRKPVLIVNRFDEQPQIFSREVAEPDDMQVYIKPESQNFLKGHDNRVLIKTEGSFNAPSRDVWILDQNNDTIKNTKLNAHGFSEFVIAPDSAANYYALIDGIDKQYKLPETTNDGCLLKVDQENNILHIKILSAGESPPIEWLRIINGDNVVYEKNIGERYFTTDININKNNIPKGLLSIEAGNHNEGRINQRFWYNDIEDNSIIKLLTDQENYGARDKIGLTIDGSLMQDDNASLSLSVVKKESVANNNLTFDGYIRSLNIANAFGYNQQKAASLFGNMKTDDLNSYLIKMEGKETFGDNNKHNSSNDYYMETAGLILSGKVTDKKSSEPVSDARVILNTPDTIINILYSKTDDNGRFNFVLSDFYYDKELYFIVDHGTVESETIIEVDDKFLHESSYDHDRFVLSKEQFDFIKKSQDILTVNRAYGFDYVSETITEKKPESHPSVMFSNARRVIYPGNFVPLDSLPEISREIVHPWRIRLRDGEYNSSLICASTGNRFPEPPVYFLDGIITYDINKLIHLDSKMIEKIQVHNYPWMYGEIYFPGIIGIFTKNNEYLNILDHRKNTSMLKESISEPVEFEGPEYKENKKNDYSKPDLRVVLHWDNDVTINKGKTKNINFFAGDLKGDYYIKLQGITSEGKPVNINKPLKIK